MKKFFQFRFVLLMAVVALAGACKTPKEDIVLRQIKDVVVDGTTDPMLKAQALFYNPNPQRGKLKRINVEIFVDGKKVGTVDQKLRTEIPSHGEFTVPLEVKLAMKEFGFLDTIFSVLGGKKFEVRYVGSLKLSYHGVPISVPVNYKDDVRVKF